MCGRQGESANALQWSPVAVCIDSVCVPLPAPFVVRIVCHRCRCRGRLLASLCPGLSLCFHFAALGAFDRTLSCRARALSFAFSVLAHLLHFSSLIPAFSLSFSASLFLSLSLSLSLSFIVFHSPFTRCSLIPLSLLALSFTFQSLLPHSPFALCSVFHLSLFALSFTFHSLISLSPAACAPRSLPGA